MSYLHKLSSSVAALALAPSVSLALTITPTNDAFGLSNTLFLNSPELFIQNAQVVSGAFGQLATYQNTSGTLGLPLNGIVMSSGNANQIFLGASTGFGQQATQEQNDQLTPITGQSFHFDPANLVIDFIATSNISSVTFFAAFASSEWPQFVGSSFSDGFGLFVNGQNVAGVQTTGGGANLPVNINHPDMVAFENVGILSPNGNPVLRFDVPVNGGQTNQFSIIIADASDSILDTGVFISSFFPTEGGGGGSAVGSSEFNPILPSNPPDPVTGAFVIELPANLPDRQVVWIDPPVSTGFFYELEGEGLFASLVAPSLATVADLDGYFITVDGGLSADLAAGGTLDFFSVFGFLPTSFTLSGINPDLSLDPSSGAAFPLGVSFVGLGANSFITQTPITTNVGPDLNPIPLPASAWLLLGAFGGLGALRRSRRR